LYVESEADSSTVPLAKSELDPVDKIRSSVLRAVEDIMIKKYAFCSFLSVDFCIFIRSHDIATISAAVVHTLATEIEEELFRLCNLSTGSRYKNWMRAFLQALQQKSNKV
jgi:hypothetical protein